MKRNPDITLISNVFITTLALSGCALRPVGDLKNLPETEQAKIYFYSDKGIESSDWKVDGVERGYFTLGHVVAPGKHSFEVEVIIKNEECIDYYRSRELCYEVNYYGECKGSVTAQPGRSYAIRMKGIDDSAFVTVSDEADDSTGGSGSCEVERSRR
jgi:hypothetical protein